MADPPHLPDPLPPDCPACGSKDAVVAERLPTEALASHWAKLAMHGEAASDEIRGFVYGDIGADAVHILRCGRCDLEFAEPRRTWRAAHYPDEKHALGWDHQEALRELAGQPRKTLLDVGCANGQFLERAAALGHRVTGVDFADDDIAAARAQGFEAYVADLSRENALVEGNRKFDVITLFQVVEHLEEPDLVFRALARLAAPGAVLMLGCPSARRYTRAFSHPELVGSSDFWDSPPQHVLRWNPAAFRAFLTRHGWTVRRTCFEPLVAYHAAAHLAGLGRFPDSPWLRRFRMLSFYVQLHLRNCTGIRLFALADRIAAPGQETTFRFGAEGHGSQPHH